MVREERQSRDDWDHNLNYGSLNWTPNGGNPQTKVLPSNSNFGHSEKLLLNFACGNKDASADPTTFKDHSTGKTVLYTERRPCPECWNILDNNLRQTDEVYYSVEYGTREVMNEALRKVLVGYRSDVEHDEALKEEEQRRREEQFNYEEEPFAPMQGEVEEMDEEMYEETEEETWTHQHLTPQSPVILAPQTPQSPVILVPETPPSSPPSSPRHQAPALIVNNNNVGVKDYRNLNRQQKKKNTQYVKKPGKPRPGYKLDFN